MIDAKRNNVEASREVIIDHTGMSWVDTHTRDEQGNRLYTNGDSLEGVWLALTKAEVKELAELDAKVADYLAMVEA